MLSTGGIDVATIHSRYLRSNSRVLGQRHGCDQTDWHLSHCVLAIALQLFGQVVVAAHISVEMIARI